MIRALLILICWWTAATVAHCQEENPFKIVEEVRTWTSSGGQHTVRAELKDVRDGIVYLITPGGKQIEVPLDKLSETDQLYIRNEPQSVVSSSVSELKGKVVGVTDGDTITLLDPNHTQHKIRLEGIDAPESHQAFGTRAKQALSEKIFNQEIRVRSNGKDKYQRILGHIYLDDRWINKELVEEGWAWHYKKYSSDEDLASAELVARANRRGLWHDLGSRTLPIAPWDFRHGGVPAASTDSNATNSPSFNSPVGGNTPGSDSSLQNSNEVTVYVTRTGTKYHSPGCRHLSKSRIPISLEEAKRKYSPCSACNPPH